MWRYTIHYLYYFSISLLIPHYFIFFYYYYLTTQLFSFDSKFNPLFTQFDQRKNLNKNYLYFDHSFTFLFSHINQFYYMSYKDHHWCWIFDKSILLYVIQNSTNPTYLTLNFQTITVEYFIIFNMGCLTYIFLNLWDKICCCIIFQRKIIKNLYSRRIQLFIFLNQNLNVIFKL